MRCRERRQRVIVAFGAPGGRRRLVLKAGGGLAIANMVPTKPLPGSVRAQLNSIASCVGGAALVDDLKIMLKYSHVRHRETP